MKPPKQAQTWPSRTRQDPGAEVHVQVNPWGRWRGSMGRRAQRWASAAGRIGPADATDRRRQRPQERSLRHFALARTLNPPDTLHHGTDLQGFRAREGGFVQRRII